MNGTRFDFLVFIGRFQPFHRGHLAVLKAGLERAAHVIVLCGSGHQARTTRNPWTAGEREAMIRGALGETESARVHVAPLMDILYNDERWVRNIQQTVHGLVTAHHTTPHKPPRIGLIGHSKDASSYYLRLFPQWGSLEVPDTDGISSTPIRDAFFGIADRPDHFGAVYLESLTAHGVLPDNVRAQLLAFYGTADFEQIRDEHRYVVEYRNAWASAPYPPTFVTVDAVVIQSGHVLLIERSARPGRGQLALPGGFLGEGEALIDTCLRQLRDETRLRVPAPVLKGSITRQRVFDDPHRSTRGRTITHAFHIDLEPRVTLPPVKAGRNVAQALWVPLADLDPKTLFEDHYFIIQEMTGM